MKRIETVYKGFRLVAIEQPSGGYNIEITPIAGGKPVLTRAFGDLSGAITSARRIVDNGVLDGGRN